jgi:autotransporter-associated beta strand protein
VLVNNSVTRFHGSTSNSAWTVALWVKTSATGAAFLYQGDGSWASGNSSFFLTSATQGSSGSFPGGHAGGVRWGGGWMGGNSNVNDGNWHFIAITDNSGAKNIFVDGNLDASYTASQMWNAVATGNQLWIGGSADTGDGNLPFNGLIDDVYIYGRALSQAEVTNLMNGVTVPSPALPSGTDLSVASGASLVLSGSTQTVGALSGGNSSTMQLGAGSTPTVLTFGTGTSTTFSGNVTGSGSLTKTGAGTITLSGVNSYSGSTTISNGTVKFGQSNNTNYVASLGPVLQLTFDQTNGGDLFVDDNGNIATNPIAAVNVGLGGTNLNGILTGAGATIVSGGRYGNALSLDGTGMVQINNKITALDCNANGASWTYALWVKTATAGATYGYQGDGTWSSAMTTFYLNGNSSSSGGTKAGGVRWGDAWLTGTATVNNNAWHFIAITVTGGVKTIYVDGNVDAQTGTTGWTAAGSTSANQFWIGQSPDLSDGAVPFNGLIDEVYLFNRALSQSEVQNIMSNKTVVATGTVTGQLPATTPVSLASGATLDLSGTTQTIASLSDLGGSGSVTNSAGTAATLTINTTATNTFSGPIGGNIGLVKSGTGMQTLNGANSYTGTTTVNGGTLALGQATLATGSTIIVTNGAVLKLNFSGTNQIAGLVLNGTNKSAGVYNSVNSAPFIAGTGSLLIPAPVATNSPTMTFTNSGGSLMLTWPSDHTGWRLQVQTNALTIGLGTNWVDVPSSTNASQMTIPFNTSNNSVFYRLVYP